MGNRIKNLILSFCMLITFYQQEVFSQEAFFRTHPISNSINNATLNTLLQDRQGFMWLGTSKGLYRFDGVSYMHFASADNLKEAAVTALFQSTDGVIWAGTKSGTIACIMKDKLNFFEPVEGNPRSAITAIAQDVRGNIWFATYGEGVYCYSDKRMYNFNTDDGLSDDYTYTLAAANAGNVWVGTDGGISICSIRNAKKSVKRITSDNGLPDNIVLKIASDGINNMWIGMQAGGICKINSITLKVEIPDKLKNWNYGTINDLLLIGNRLWAATDEQGIVATDLQPDSRIHTYTKMAGINYPKVLKIAADSQGNVWFVSSTALIQSPGSKLEMLSVATNINFANIHSVLCDHNGDVWYSNDDGLFRYRRSSGFDSNPEKVLSIPGIKGMKIISLYQDRDGYIWIGTFGNGLMRLNPKTSAVVRYSASDGLMNGNILSITGFDNELWFATLGGALRCLLPPANSAGTKLKFEGFGQASGLGNNFIYSVFADSKMRIWFATDGKGITVREKKTFRNYSDAYGLKSKVVYSVAEDKTGNIWFSTANSGLYKFDGKISRNYTLGQGLSNLEISGITTAKSDKIFIVHSKGIDILDSKSETFSYLGADEGLKDINPDLNAISVDTLNNLIWIGTPKGIIKLEADKFTDAVRPQIQLRQVLVFLNPTDTLAEHVFNHNENHLSFEYSGLWYSAPERLSYQVMLKGYDLDWITTKNTSVIYSSLEPGKYTFMVRTSLSNDFSHSTIKSYQFEISKPLWKTTWFLLLVLLIVSSAVYLFIRSRESRLRHEDNLQKEKIAFQFETLKSQVNPHFLFNSFSTLSAIIDEDKEMALDYVQKLSVFFRNILEYRDKTVITLREEILLADTYYYLQKKRYGDNFNLLINIPEPWLSSFIPPLTLQMILENAVKHNVVSADKPLTVSITVESDYLIIHNPVQVKINQAASTGIGLSNIRNRYRLLINKDIEIEFTPTDYIVKLPVINTIS